MRVLPEPPYCNSCGRLRRLGRPAAIRRIHPLRYDAFQPHAARMIEDRETVTRQMLIEMDGLPLLPADQSGEPLLAFDQRQVAQVGTIVLQQAEGIQQRLWLNEQP